MTQEKEIQANTGMVTMADVAARCGVSISTVSRVLRGDTRCARPELVQQIHAEAEALGYDLSLGHSARRLVFCRTEKRVLNNVIAYFSPLTPLHRRHVYYQEILQGMLDVLVPQRYALLIMPQLLDDDPLPYVIRRGEVDAAIVLQNWQAPARLRTEPGFSSRPIVSLMSTHEEGYSVRCDDLHDGRLAAGHLLDLGHHHLMHFISPQQRFIRQQRLLGYRLAYQDRGLDPDRFLHFAFMREHFDEEDTGYIHEALAAHPEVTGILSPHDEAALFLARVVREHGLRIPDDISLVGSDDTHVLPDANGDNLLTTVRLPLAEVGRTAVRTVLRQLEHGEVPGAQEVLPVELVVRGSTTPPRRSAV